MHAFASALLAVAVVLAGAAARPLAAADGWVPVGPPGGPVRHLLVHPRDPRVLWAGTQSSGVFKSVDGGASWQSANQGLITSNILALTVAPSTPNTLYLAAGTAGVFRSTDGGATWKAVLPCRQQPLPCCGCVPLSRTRELAVHVRNPQIVFAATDRGIFKSVDGGARWRQSGLGGGASKIVADPRAGSYFYRVRRSPDGGDTWADRSGNLPRFAALRMPPSPPHPGDSTASRRRTES